MFSLGEDITQKQIALEALRESEEQNRRITEGIPLALYRSTPDGRILYGNRVLAELMNIQDPKQLESINLQTTDTGPTYNRDEFNAELEKNGEIIGLEYQWKRPNQEPRWVRENARAIRDASGKVQWYEGTLEDITDAKIAQEKLVQSEELYRKLSETAPIGILLTRNAVVQHANPFVAQLLGYDSSEDLVVKPILDFVHPSDRQYVRQTYIQTPVEPFKQTTEERRLLRKDGSAIMIQAFISQLMVNRQRGSIIVIRDISAQRQSEQEMRRWQQRMLKMQKLESLGLLAGGMAHDFNNQLTVIMGHASLLEKQLPADDQLHKLLKPIELAAQHATNLCQQMLSFAGRGKIETHQVNLTQLIRNSEALLKIALGKRADLLLELDPDLPTIQAEEAQIRQVLINLIANSADSFTTGHRGHVTLRTFVQEVTADYPKIEVTLELPAGKYVCLDVIDDGCGMEIDSRRRIFEPFFTTKPTGRGLGLPLVLGIVRSHQGAIEVHSKLRQGTSIRIFLPLEVQAPPAVPEKPVSATILVVDDELSLRSLASQVLRNHGFRVLEAEDGYQACELVQKSDNPIQLVLVDLTMPV
ncbi:MAG TPA: PAS domain S-box protein, partial [Gemmatales bacterium]|nr:PAS domain S-box protein [Gemmatales bacterium]